MGTELLAAIISAAVALAFAAFMLWSQARTIQLAAAPISGSGRESRK